MTVNLSSAAVRQRRYRSRYRDNPAFRANVKAQAAAWAAANPERVRENGLRAKYGMTLDDLDELIEAQAGLCGICTEPMRPGRDTCVDHCHKTGRVRGLLCRSCNTRLGRLENDPLVGEATMAYAESA